MHDHFIQVRHVDLSFISGFTSDISYFMYIFSNSLLYPVCILLVILIIFSLLLVGEFITEYTRRVRDPVEMESVCASVRKEMAAGKYSDAADAIGKLSRQSQVIKAFAADIPSFVRDNNVTAVERTADEYEVRMIRRVEKTKIITTVGPMLGLMGTLIPLSPALIGLTTGNVEALATNLVVAFATTVIGLFAAGLSYCMTTVRQRWYWQDSMDMDYLIHAVYGDND